LKSRNAIRILQVNEYPDELINEAIEVSNLMENIALCNNMFKLPYLPARANK
jgi:hypothetical protein